jgi:glycosyltransferase involved in cell wall biosynthesis
MTPAEPAERVTLVIPGRNAARTLPVCLEAVVPLLGKDGLQEIIFVDDGSTDDTAAVVARYPVRYVTGGGGGPGHARNVGWRAAVTPLVWFIDSDCVAEPDALSILLSHLEAPGVVGVGGSYGNRRPESLLACLIHEEMVERHLVMPAEMDFLASYNVLYRRSALEAAGGFDEGNFNGPGAPGAEDIELSFRLHDAGHRMRFDIRSRVGHFHPTNLRRYLRAQRYHGYFRVWLYLHHRSRAGGDVYSGLLDHIQPPLAMLLLALLPALPFWPPLAWAALPGAVALLAAQLPMTVRLVRRLRRPRYLLFAPFGWVRAFARGLGMSYAVLRFVIPWGARGKRAGLPGTV